jgi:hypothetical protein
LELHNVLTREEDKTVQQSSVCIPVTATPVICKIDPVSSLSTWNAKLGGIKINKF